MEYTADANPFGCFDFPHSHPTPQLAKTTAKHIAALAYHLKQAADAHHAHEAALGHPDADWPTWYATYLVEHIDVSPTR